MFKSKSKKTASKADRAAQMRADIGAGAEKSVPKKKAAKKNSKKRSLLRRIFGFCFYWGLVLGLWAGIASICLLGFYAAQLPQSSTWKVPERPPNATILSANGHLIANRGNSGGKSIRLAQISPAIPEAVISVEDRRFYWHFGIDPIGLIRASYKNWQAGRVIEGGSTLTQQLAKNLFLKPERTFKRKMQEVVLAFWLEWKYSKKELLEIYLNRVYLGAGAYGVDAASKRYFKKPPQNVNLMEAATLAGLLKAPSRYAPSKNPKLARERASVVLSTMVNAGYISEKERHKALTTQGIKAPKIKLGSEHYAADLAMQEFQEFIGKLSEDVIIETSLDLNLQKQAEKAVSATLKKYGKRLNVTQGAMISLAPNGEVKIIIGGRNYNLSQYNRAANAKRQPGSAFKPIVFLSALEQGMTPFSLRVDEPIKIGNWRPQNYKKTYKGSITLDEALSLSINTVAAKLINEVGIKKVIQTARRLGIRSPLRTNASFALGPSEVTLLELTNAYANFANGGFGVIPHIIKRVTTRDGKVLYDYHHGQPPRTIKPEILGQMNMMMRHVVEHGTGKHAQIKPHQIAGKTGTTQGFKDGIFIGYSAHYITGVWYGNDNNKPMRKVTGGSLPALTFANFMRKAHHNLNPQALPGNYDEKTIMRQIEANSIDTLTPSDHNNGHNGSSISELLKHLNNGELSPAPAPNPNGDLRPSEDVGAQLN